MAIASGPVGKNMPIQNNKKANPTAVQGVQLILQSALASLSEIEALACSSNKCLAFLAATLVHPAVTFKKCLCCFDVVLPASTLASLSASIFVPAPASLPTSLSIIRRHESTLAILSCCQGRCEWC